MMTNVKRGLGGIAMLVLFGFGCSSSGSANRNDGAIDQAQAAGGTTSSGGAGGTLTGVGAGGIGAGGGAGGAAPLTGGVGAGGSSLGSGGMASGGAGAGGKIGSGGAGGSAIDGGSTGGSPGQGGRTGQGGSGAGGTSVIDANPVDSDHGIDAQGLAALCTSTGGQVVTASCCTSIGDFQNTCLSPTCACAPAYSHDVLRCNCPAQHCFATDVGCK